MTTTTTTKRPASTVALAGIALALVLAPTAGQAGTMRKAHHATQPVQVQSMPYSHIERPALDMSGGNAAAGGNNANSMSGSNSAGENANGRSSGGYGG